VDDGAAGALRLLGDGRVEQRQKVWVPEFAVVEHLAFGGLQLLARLRDDLLEGAGLPHLCVRGQVDVAEAALR
jgi:hypothetical protein